MRPRSSENRTAQDHVKTHSFVYDEKASSQLPSPEFVADAKNCADNVKYFGDAVYEYDMAQAIEDGYLGACEIQKGRVNIDDTGFTQEEIIARHPVDAITGLPVTAQQIDELYSKTQYEDRIMLPDRVLAMCRDLFQYLLATGGPEQKTIIFCKTGDRPQNSRLVTKREITTRRT